MWPTISKSGLPALITEKFQCFSARTAAAFTWQTEGLEEAVCEDRGLCHASVRPVGNSNAKGIASSETD